MIDIRHTKLAGTIKIVASNYPGRRIGCDDEDADDDEKGAARGCARHPDASRRSDEKDKKAKGKERERERCARRESRVGQPYWEIQSRRTDGYETDRTKEKMCPE